MGKKDAGFIYWLVAGRGEDSFREVKKMERWFGLAERCKKVQRWVLQAQNGRTMVLAG